MPKRIYFNRFKGKLPENTKLVTRPSKFSNPFTIQEHGRTKALRLFEDYLDAKIIDGSLDLRPLKGFDLACNCKLSESCHADILLNRLKRLRINE
jgi:hypothetical protein